MSWQLEWVGESIQATTDRTAAASLISMMVVHATSFPSSVLLSSPGANGSHRSFFGGCNCRLSVARGRRCLSESAQCRETYRNLCVYVLPCIRCNRLPPEPAVNNSMNNGRNESKKEQFTTPYFAEYLQKPLNEKDADHIPRGHRHLVKSSRITHALRTLQTLAENRKFMCPPQRLWFFRIKSALPYFSFSSQSNTISWMEY